MTERTQKLLDEVLALPTPERLDFIEKLMVSQGHDFHGFASAEIADAWDAEIARRLDEVDSGKVKPLSQEEFWARMQASKEPGDV
jgi:putative addiction module component (TIGR02574 family)